jgi:nucleotide-binding universal stress UspA family protein
MERRRSDDGAASTAEAVVVPLDGSEISERAIRIATVLAAGAGARLVLVAALEPGEVELESHVEKIAAGIHDVDTSVMFIRDRPAAEAITLVALEAGRSAVCMTTHGRGALRWAMLGSVAEQVVRESQRPVFLVGRGCDPGWSPRGGEMLVCLSGAEESEVVADDAVVWAHAFELEMQGAVVMHPLDIEGAEHTQDLLGPIEERLARRNITLPLAVLRSSYPAGALVDYAEHIGASMIAMASHGRTGLGRVALGSVTMALVGLAVCPVLVTFRSK